MQNKRKIFFNEELHKYTDDLDNVYTSTTTLVGKYYEKFKAITIADACERIGRNPRHPKYLKYKNKTATQLMYEWETKANDACAKGTKKHNYFESAIKASNNYNKVKDTYINDRIYTIDEVIDNTTLGRLSIDFFIKKGVKEHYPEIFKVIETFHNLGYRIHAEIGVYNPQYLVSGLIDVLFINEPNYFILDWKTNEAPIKYEAGYFEKDNNGNLTDLFVYKDENFYHPIDHVAASTGNKYSMQLSGYGVQIEDLVGLQSKGSVIAQIRDVSCNGTIAEQVSFVKTVDLRNEFRAIMQNHYDTIKRNINTQSKLF